MLEKCPKCGGHLTDEPGNEYLVCDDCGEMYLPEVEETRLSVEDAPKIVDQTVELKKIATVKKIVYPIMIVLMLLCVGLIFYEINEYSNAADVKSSIGAYSDFDDSTGPDSIPDKKLTNEIMRADYEEFYASRYQVVTTIVIIACALVGIAVIWIISMIVIEIVAARIFERPKNRQNIRLFSGLAAAGTLAIIITLIIMGNTIPSSPKHAKFDIVTKEYLGKRMDRTYNSLNRRTHIHYSVKYAEDGEEVDEGISEYKYHHVYPSKKGEYYFVSVDGKLFHLYPTSTYRR